jgi:predicted transposase/invertase (TIGR01784 family)
MKYLDPKADLTFKRVFGEHPELVKSFLNALLPLDEGEEIVHISYLPTELLPDAPLYKNSIVDVRCEDNRGRQFIVEMQLAWTPAFMQRVLFNASKAYVKQLDLVDPKRKINYELLQPVYSLNLVNTTYDKSTDNYYHHYQIVCIEESGKVIEGLQFVFIELPKYKPETFHEKKMKVLWLRYLKEIDENTVEAPAELLADPQIKEAIEIVKVSAYTDAQLRGYDKFWDNIMVENTLYSAAERKGREQGREEGREEGREQGREEGIALGIAQSQAKVVQAEAKFIETARKFKALGASIEMIMQATGLSREAIEKL